ncbi:MAG: cytochrome c [Candidatus Promineifilaceae bacterium]
MKKFIVVFISLIMMVLLLSGCNQKGNADQEAAAEFVSPLVGDPIAGDTLFHTTCFACHGDDATGLPGQGKDLTTSTFVRGLTDQELVEFVTNGRRITDPLNTTGVDMPPKGGNPAFTEQDLYDIVAYIRSLEK